MVIKHIKPIRLVIDVQLIRLMVIRHIRPIRLVIKQLRLLIKVNEQLVFQRLNIQLFQQLFLMGYIQYIFLDKLKEYIQFNIQLHSNQ